MDSHRTGTIRKSSRRNLGIPPQRYPDPEYKRDDKYDFPVENEINVRHSDSQSKTVDKWDFPINYEMNAQVSKACSRKSTSSRKSRLTESIQTLESLHEMDELEKEMAAIKAEEIEARKLEVMRKMDRLKAIEKQKIIIKQIVDEEETSDEDEYDNTNEDDVFLSIKSERIDNWVGKQAQLKPTSSWHGNISTQKTELMNFSSMNRAISTKNINDVPKNNIPFNQYRSQQCGDNFQQDQSEKRYNQPIQNENVTSNEVLLAAFKALQIKQIRDLPVFDGENVLEWPNFLAEYKRSTRECNIQSETNLRRLNAALKGVARESVQALLSYPERVDDIISTLELNFGRPEWIIVKLMNDLRAFPVMREEGIEQFRAFYNKINNVSSTMRNLNAERYTDSPDLLSCMEDKLPLSTKGYWIRHKAELLRNGKPVTLSALGEWFKIELDVQYAGVSVRDISKRQNNSGYQRKANIFVMNDQNERSKFSYCVKCRTTGHGLSECKSFKEMDVKERRHLVLKQNCCFLCLGRKHSVKFCREKENIGKCPDCQSYHHKLLHMDDEEKVFQVKEEKNTEEVKTEEVKTEKVNHVNCTSDVLLRVGQVNLRGPKGVIKVFAFFDEGSTASMIDESLVQKLGLEGPKSSITYRWTNDIVRTDNDSMLVDVDVSAPYENSKYFELSNIRTVKNLSLPHQKLDVKHVMNLHPYVDRQKIEAVKDVKPLLLIGSNNSGLIVPLKTIQYKINGLQQCKSRLGWTVHGIVSEQSLKEENNFTLSVHVCYESKSERKLNELIKESYVIENFGINDEQEKLAEEDEKALQIMKSTMEHVGDRFQIGQLYRYPGKKFPTAESKTLAIKRLRFVEQKMDKDMNFAKAYIEKINEYVSKGYAEKLNPEEACNEPSNTFYLPHFGVYNVNKPGKFRWVMDAKAKAGNYSLNDLLLQGPDFVPSLLAVLWRARLKKIAISADIREMFHQVLIRPEDRDSQRFLFRGIDRDNDPDVYRMNAMIFGAVSSPSMAQYVKNENAKRMETEYPGVLKAISQQHYVDDYLDSTNTVEEAIELASNVMHVHKKGGFELVKWISNSTEFLNRIPEECRLPDYDKVETVRVLGLQWNIKTDNFEFPLEFSKFDEDFTSGKMVPTKRQLLRFMMSIFDPVGFLSPLVIKLKILFQESWRSGIKWDEKISSTIYENWLNWLKEVKTIRQVVVPRCYFPLLSNYDSAELHVIVDAGEKAYCAVTYLRVKIADTVHTAIVQAKARVAPVKNLSIPRLELQAAVTGSQIAKKISEELGINIESKHYWCDSTCVLSWINTKEKLCAYVGSRITKILETSTQSDWHWIPSELNTADLATKLSNEIDFSSESSWLYGPKFLKESCLPVFTPPPNTEENVLTILAGFEVVHENTDEKEVFPVPNIDNFSKYNRLVRATAYLLKMVKNLKLDKKNRPAEFTIDVHDIDAAKKLLLKKVQSDSFSKEINDLKKYGIVKKSSPLYQLSPFINEQGIICMKGRIPGYNPVILDHKHRFTHLLVYEYHDKNLHQGMDTVISMLRESFWITKIRMLVRSVFKQCLVCKLRKPKVQPVEMGYIPEERSEECTYPFTFTGIDYFGPIMVKVGRQYVKHWGALFTCMTIRAVHVELVPSLNTNSAIMAITRFMNLRGVPKKIFTDNGTCFVGAKNELQEFISTLDHEKISENLSVKNVEWVLIPPAAPHFGGTWERMVRSVKEGLKVIINVEFPSYEVLSTALSEIVNTINNRPLTYVSSDCNDLKPISPNDIVLLRTNHSQYDVNMDFNYNPKQTWKLAHSIADNFWKRWMKEYRPSLLKRNKWPDNRQDPKIAVGDLVFILDENLTRGKYPKGVITKVFPDKTGLVRVAEVKTMDGIYKRPVVKLGKIDISSGF